MERFSPVWLFHIRDHGVELLPRQNLKCLEVFLGAFQVRLISLGLAPKGECRPPPEFGTWLAERFQIPGQFNSFSLVSLRYGSEGLAMVRFFELLEEFWGTQPIKRSTQAAAPPSGLRSVAVDWHVVLQGAYARPALYLGEKSLTALYSWIEGTRYAIRYAGLKPIETPSIRDVEMEILSHFGCPLDCDPRQVLLTFSQNDEEKAFERFYRFLDAKIGGYPVRQTDPSLPGENS